MSVGALVGTIRIYKSRGPPNKTRINNLVPQPFLQVALRTADQALPAAGFAGGRQRRIHGLKGKVQEGLGRQTVDPRLAGRPPWNCHVSAESPSKASLAHALKRSLSSVWIDFQPRNQM